MEKPSPFSHVSERSVQQFQSKIIEQEIEPIKNIYFDLRCLKDIQLGALLTLVYEKHDEEAYKYILSRLHIYRTRMYNDTMQYFPDLTYTEEQICERLADPLYTDKILALSPTTGCYENLHRILYVIKRRNDHFDRQYPTRIIFNVHPFKLTPVIQNFFTRVIYQICPHFKVGFIQKPLKQLQLSSLMENGKIQFKIFFIWDAWDTFLSDDSHLKTAFTEDMLFFNTQIYSSKKFQVQLNEDQLEEGYHNLNILKGYFNICCDFEYADFEVCLHDPSDDHDDHQPIEEQACG